MATDAPPLRTRRRTLLAAAQTTTGTPATLDATAGAFVAYTDDSPIDETIEMDTRPYMDDIKNYPGVPGGQMAKITFELDVIGAATGVPAWASLFLPACGFALASRTFTFDPFAQTTIPTLTVGIIDGTRIRTISDALGTISFPLRSGHFCKAKVELTGVLLPDADTTVITPTRPSTLPPRFANTGAFTLGSYTPRVSAVDIDFAVDVVMREDANAASGYRSAMIVDAGQKMTIDPEAQTVATLPIQSLLLASTEMAWSAVLGSITGNIVTFSSSKAQINKRNGGARNKMITDPIDVMINDKPQVIFS